MKKTPQNRLFKWIGGKSWMKEQLTEAIDDSLKGTKVDTYIEPFVGGMGAFLAVFETIRQHGIKNIIVNDVNHIIINTFVCVKEDKEELIKKLKKIEYTLFQKTPIYTLKNNEVVKLTELHGVKDKEIIKKTMKEAQEFYNTVRSVFNDTKYSKEKNVETSAMFLFLMGHCFNGVYRENSKGGYNVPFNWYHKEYNLERKIEAINEFSTFFNSNNITFTNLDVFVLIEKYRDKNALYYIDPPYMNEATTENKYSEDGFDNEKQLQLLHEISLMEHLVYSNHSTKTIKNFMNDNNIQYSELYRKNTMSASVKSRKNDIAEILATR